MKKVLQSDILRSFVCWIGSLWIRFVYATGQWDWLNEEIPQKYWNDGKPFILAFWHGRLLMMPYSWPVGVPINMLISQHRDGELIAKTVGHFGIDTVRGSTGKEGRSSKGGAQALRAMVKTLKDGGYIGITPDGPRGPRMRASEGIVAVARLSGCPIIPVSFSVRRSKILSSWDRFVLALPFTKGVFIWGDPIFVDRSDDPATKQREIEQSLNWISEKADSKMGRKPIEPAPEPEA